MRKLLLVSLLVFLVFVQAGFAQDFTANAAAGSNYLAGREYVINLTVTNTGLTDWFTVSVIGLPSDWLSVDTTSGLFKISSGETEIIKIFVRPGKDAIPTSYEYFINVKNTRTDESVEERVLVPVKQVTEVIVSNLEFSCQECSREVTITGDIVNTGTKDMDVDFTLDFLDNTELISAEGLRVFEQQDFSYTYDLEDLSPGTYNVSVQVEGNSKVLFQDTKSFIIPRVQDVEFEENVYATPFGRFVRIKAFNNGNYRADVEFESTVNEAWYILYAGPEPNTEGNTTTWIVNLNAEQDYTLGFSEIYWPTYIFVAILIFVAFFVYWNYTAVTIKKAIVGKNIVKKGKDLSVSITIKNKIRKLSNVVIRDVVPEGFTLVTKFATVKPTLRKVAGGIELVWKLGDIKPHEQRVLHYKIKPTKSMRGRKHLSKASIVAKFGDKKIKKSSNYVTIYSSSNEPSTIAVDITKE